MLFRSIKGANDGVTITPEDPNPEVPGDPDTPVVDTDPSTQGDSLTVYENAIGEASNVASGVMDITAPDGVKSVELSYGGESVTVPLTGGEVTISTDEGTLTASYADGQLSYSYELTQSTQEHTVKDEADTISHDITVTVTDNNDDTGTSTIRVNVVDDLPEAQDITGEITEDATPNTITGMADFSYGADDGTGASIAVTKGEAKYGTFVMDADGNYTYTLDNSLEAVQALYPDEIGRAHV